MKSLEDVLKRSVRQCLLFAAWLTLIGVALHFHSAHPSLLGGGVQGLASASTFWACVLYLLLGCVRGFTFMPAPVLMGIGLLFLPPVPLFILTMIGVLMSSAGIYYFSSSFQIYEHFQRKGSKQLAAIESGLKSHELPIIIGWSFFPVLPTDAVCCISGVMKMNVAKLLFGVLIGEGLCAALYIFFGNQLFHFLRFGA
jgi:uncharacterized membrane protein YdjX (TVP38/TMEM64 family)